MNGLTMRPRRQGAFTMMEFILVVAISAILIVGLAAVVDVPRQMAERELSGDTPLSHADRALARLDEEIRFARSAVAPDPLTLELTAGSGESIRYSWDGSAGGALVRMDSAGSAAVLRNVEDLAFAVALSPRTLVGQEEKSMEQVTVETMSFATWSLKSGYQLTGGTTVLGGSGSLLGGTVVLVTESRNTVNIGGSQQAALLFRAGGLAGDAGAPAALRLRLRRNGGDALQVRIYRADLASRTADTNELVATGTLASGALPLSLGDVTVPLAYVQKMEDGSDYMACVSSAGSGAAADMEYVTLSDPDAATFQGGGFLRSADGGASFAPLAVTLDASQSPFVMEVVKTQVSAEDGSSVTVEMIPTSVIMKVALTAAEGGQPLHVAFPIENNIALLGQ